PAQAEVDRDVTRGGVGDHLGDDERADLARAALQEAGVLLLPLVEAADAAAQDGAAAVRVLLREVQAAVLDGGDGRHQGELGEAVEVAGGLAVEDGGGVEVLDLAAELDLEGGGVELLDRRDAAAAGTQPLPESPDVLPEGVDRA